MLANSKPLIQKNSHQTNVGTDKVVQIAGAGPAGLSAAITLAGEGYSVQVHEANAEVGFRFQGDLQGLENWSSEQDVLDWLQIQGITTHFARLTCRKGMAFDANGTSYDIHCDDPLFYMVERGPGPDSLDTALLNQALELGVEVRFNSRLNKFEGAGILATGPRAADAIAVGYHFDTDMDDGFWVICDDNLAPKGYAYLLVMHGQGTVKSCMFTDFSKQRHYVQRTVSVFEERVGLRMTNPRPHGGVGNFHIPLSALQGGHPVVGEQAGFQDTLWGFGMRHAILSGVLAARSLIAGTDYNKLWYQEMRQQMQAAVVNRCIFELLGNKGYRRFLSRVTRGVDPRATLRKHYNLAWYKRLLLPWAKLRYSSRYKDKNCHHDDCMCVSCQDGRG